MKIHVPPRKLMAEGQQRAIQIECAIALVASFIMPLVFAFGVAR